MDKISLEGMEFLGRHGCFPEEHEKEQRFLVDVVLFLPLENIAESDALEDTIDYGVVFEQIRTIVEGSSCNLIETLAERIAQKLLASHERLQKVRVTVHKPNAPIAGIFQDIKITIKRARI